MRFRKKTPTVKGEAKVEARRIKSLICAWQYGERDEYGTPKNVNFKANLELWLNRSALYPPPMIQLYKIDQHRRGLRTMYFAGNGRQTDQYSMFNIDIDSKHKQGLGTQDGALKLAQKLADAGVLKGMAHEPSTNGVGRHGYVILDKQGLNAEEANAALKHLEKYLEAVTAGEDVELVEVMGTCPVTREVDGRVRLTDGVLAKLPRTVKVEDMPIVKAQDLLALKIPERAEPEEKKQFAEGSVSRLPFCLKEFPVRVQAVTPLARKVLGADKVKVYYSGARQYVTVEDMAILIALIRSLPENADHAQPGERFQKVWRSLYKTGQVSRGFNYANYTIARNLLIDHGVIENVDERYHFYERSEDGKKLKGVACRWKLNDTYKATIDRAVEALTTTKITKEDVPGLRQVELVRVWDVVLVDIRYEYRRWRPKLYLLGRPELAHLMFFERIQEKGAEVQERYCARV